MKLLPLLNITNVPGNTVQRTMLQPSIDTVTFSRNQQASPEDFQRKLNKLLKTKNREQVIKETLIVDNRLGFGSQYSVFDFPKGSGLEGYCLRIKTSVFSDITQGNFPEQRLKGYGNEEFRFEPVENRALLKYDKLGYTIGYIGNMQIMKKINGISMGMGNPYENLGYTAVFGKVDPNKNTGLNNLLAQPRIDKQEGETIAKLMNEEGYTYYSLPINTITLKDFDKYKQFQTGYYNRLKLLDALPPKAYKDAAALIRETCNLGAAYDFDTGSNILVDKNKGFQFIDFGLITNFSGKANPGLVDYELQDFFHCLMLGFHHRSTILGEERLNLIFPLSKRQEMKNMIISITDKFEKATGVQIEDYRKKYYLKDTPYLKAFM